MKEKTTSAASTAATIYNRAKTWQLAFFALNNTSTNIAMFFMGYYAMFTQNVLGLSAVVIGVIGTSMRIFDGLTDPLIGFFIDKTNGKFGKFRPFMFIGNLIIIVSMIAIFNCPLDISIMSKYIYTTVWYVIYILGYTCQTACTKGAQTALTNDPKQRPVFSAFNAVFNVFAQSGLSILLMSMMKPRYAEGLMSPILWKHAVIIVSVVMTLITLLAIAGIWSKDRTEFFGLGKKQVIKFRDFLPIIQKNRPLQMLILAASTDKLANTTSNAARVYLFANLFLNVSLQGAYSKATMIPQVVLLVLLVLQARRGGQKKIFVAGTWASLVLLCAMWLVGVNPASPMVFLALMFLQGVAGQVSSNVVNTMIADCADYETYRSGKFMPGMIGTMFSFVDKLITSFSSTIWGITLGALGLAKVAIVPDTFISNEFNLVVMIFICGLPMIGDLATLIAMKFYPLDKAKMEEVQSELSARKHALEAETADAAE